MSMLRTVKHSYACSVLRKNNCRIVKDGIPILFQLYPIEYPPLTSYLSLGINYAEPYLDKPIKRSYDYDYLNQLGFKIIEKDMSRLNFGNKRVGYELSPIDSIGADFGSLPKGHYFEYDLINKHLSFFGSNSSKQSKRGISLKKRPYIKQGHNSFFKETINSYADNLFYKGLPKELRNKTSAKLIPIPEAILGITEEGEICCFEKTEESPRVSISGESGMGKTMTMDNLEGQFKNKFDWNIMNIHDVKGDTQTRCLPWDKDSKFYNDLELFHEPSVPVPYIYLYPNMNTLTKDKILYHNEVGFEFYFPAKNFFSDNQLTSYNPRWEATAKGFKYLAELVSDEKNILGCKSLEEVNSLIKEKIPEKMIDSLGASLFRLIKDVWNRKILDISNNKKSEWKAIINGKEYVSSPYNICLLTGICPSIITEEARNEDWFAVWLKHILQDVFKFSTSKEYREVQGKNIILSGDELSDILTTPATKNIINKVIREGRTKYIGWLQATQFFSEVPESIITNITHFIAFNTQATSDIDFFRKKYTLSKTQVKDLKSQKKFQCYAFGEFILYNSYGDRYSNDGKPVKIIFTKPPNAQNFGGYKTLNGGKK